MGALSERKLKKKKKKKKKHSRKSCFTMKNVTKVSAEM